jgi:hypothetical protein
VRAGRLRRFLGGRQKAQAEGEAGADEDQRQGGRRLDKVENEDAEKEGSSRRVRT